jgi:glycyl-tRNA synthetase beta chain
VLAAEPPSILAAHRRALALEAVREKPAFRAIVTPAKRATNLVRKVKGGAGPVDPSRFVDPAEGALHAALERASRAVEAATAKADDAAALDALSAVNEAIEDYFKKVLVMHEDPLVKENRVATLRSVSALFRRTADLSKLVVEGEK